VTTPFATQLLGWKPNKSGGFVANCADIASEPSKVLAGGMLDALGIRRNVQSNVPKDPGRPLETFVAETLAADLPKIDPSRPWYCSPRGRRITEFVQYSHLKDVDELVKQSADLRITLGRDYLITPDVCVALLAENPLEPSFLHASVSCKWTIRSDRVQNIRHENNQMIRHRRARLPHLVTVTAEPLPSRLASIARGTGEVDAVYHIAFGELEESVKRHAGKDQREAWDECVGQRRLLPFSALAPTLAKW
jgi:hypothetical protein